MEWRALLLRADARRPRLRRPPCAPQPLPFHYIEISVALFKYAGDAFGERRQRVYDLVDNIRRRVPCQRTGTTPRLT